MYKIITILGNRPQFIKAVLLSRKFDAHPDFQEILVHTGQHFDKNMSDVFFEELSLKEPVYNLGVHSLERDDMVETITTLLIPILKEENPDLVLVYGDTNSTLAGALAAKLFSIPIVHVEAGLRSFDTDMPEEANREWVDHISHLLFVPSPTAALNLGHDDYTGEVVLSGDIMKDMLIHYANKTKKPKNLNIETFVLATIHRQANTDDVDTLTQIVDALNVIHSEIPVVCPLHPRTKKMIETYELKPQFLALPPVSYLEMLYLIQKATFVVTDSGGVQKEAYYFQKPTIVVRDTSEWVELLEAGYSLLCDPVSKKTILENYEEIKRNETMFKENFYGDGNAADIIFYNIQKNLSTSFDSL